MGKDADRINADDAERALVKAVRGGDPRAFAALLEGRMDRLLRHVGRNLPAKLRRRVSASDIVQDALLTVHDKFGEFEYRGPAALYGWMEAIADETLRGAVAHHLRPQRRRAAREVSRGQRPDTHQMAAKLPSPIEQAIGSELSRRVEAERRRLRPAYREVLRLYAECELRTGKFAEMGRRLGRSAEATRKLYDRALAALEAAVCRSGD